MKFQYKVFGQDGLIRNGEMAGISRDDVIHKLQSEGDIIIEIKEQDITASLSLFDRYFNKVKQEDIVIFTKQLSNLLGNGIQALRAFRLLASDVGSKALSLRLSIIADDIQQGLPIWKALLRHPDVFDTFYVAIVHSGEETGKLKDSLEYLANYITNTYELNRKTKKALTYPAFVVVVFIGVMMIMSIYVIPQLSSLLSSQGAALPLPTKIVIASSDFLREYWYVVIAFMVGIVSYFFYVNSTPAGKAYIDYIKLKIPIINKLLNKLYISRFATNLNTMLSSGISMVEALNITSEVVDNYVYKKMIERILARVENGKSLSSAMSEETLMPNIMIQMTRIGEETGSIGPMLSSIADFYTKELERTIDTTISLIEPLMVVVMGVAVGGLMAAVLLPLYNLTSSIS